MSEIAFQDRMPALHCYGCGPDNPDGLQIKSYWDEDDVAVCSHRAKPTHCAGPEHFVYGGLIASLIDCHSICTAGAHSYRQAGREVGEGDAIFLATGSLQVEYHRPVPIEEEMELRARVVESDEKRARIACTLHAGGKQCATGDVVAVRVPASWGAARR